MPPEKRAKRELALFTHLYGIDPDGIKRKKPSVFAALHGEMGWLLYIRDRAVKELHFMQIDRDKLAEDTPHEQPDPKFLKARERFYGQYGLPDFSRHKATKLAAGDFLDALDAGEVPSWVLAVAPPIDELKEVAGRQ